jgi:hypothetical protein
VKCKKTSKGCRTPCLHAMREARPSVSQNSNVKLRDLAASIVTRVSGKPPRPASPFEEDD